MNAMPQDVFFIRVEQGEDPSSIAKKLKALYDASGAGDSFKKGDYIAVKTHFGESDNTTFINPQLIKTIVNQLRQKGAKPFLTETSTLYRGDRSNAFDHIALAQRHGFGFDAIKAPLIMADGLFGDEEVEIEINGKHFQKVNIAREIAKVHGIIAASHFTGHMAAGFGCAIKNIGMGLASRKGKMKQHSVMSPQISRDRCTACEVCIKWCPQDTISLVDGKAFIFKEKCIGCGECLAVCTYGAVLFDWRRESRALQEMMAEHAAGVITAVNKNIFFFNFLINITKDCDCGNGGAKVSKDIGIVAGSDVVAVETASYDLIKKANGAPIDKLAYPNIDPLVQVRHAQKLGLGVPDYRLVEVASR